MKREEIIEIKNAKVFDKYKEEIVVLKGVYPSDDSNFIESLKLSIKGDETKERDYDLQLSGYNFKMFIGSFSNEEIDDILVYGETGGTGGYVIINVYSFYNNIFNEVFNGDKFAEKNKCNVKFLEGYKVEVNCKKVEMKYIVDISSGDKKNLDKIYDIDGKIITNIDPEVSFINKAMPIYDLDSGFYKVHLLRRIIGINNSSTLGFIYTVISLDEETIKINDQYGASIGESISEYSILNNKKEDILRMLPEGAVILNFNKFGGNNGLIIKDIDCDGKDEILCGYKYKDNQYLAVFREEQDIVKLIDSICGNGYDISDIIFSNLRSRGNSNIIVGWRIGSIWSVLDVLEFKDDKFNKILKGDKINYSKIEVIEASSKRGEEKAIALWTHETGEAYNVQIYSLRGEVLQKNPRYDREYFSKVEEYYSNLILRTRETPQYLYFLIDSQYKAGKRREALENINKALKHPKPYPSLDELKRLKRKITN